MAEKITSHGLTPDIYTDELLDPCLDLPSWRFRSRDILSPTDPEELVSKTRETLLEELPDSNLISQAVDFSTYVHSGKTRKVSGVPYILHPYDTAYIVSRVTDNPLTIVKSLLHDNEEDSPLDENGNKIVTHDVLTELFGEDIANGVERVTSDEPVGPIPEKGTVLYDYYWLNKKLKALEKIVNSEDAIIIKSADILSNMHDLLRDMGLNVDKDEVLGNRVFDYFPASQPIQLLRFTISADILAQAHNRLTGKENPMGTALLTITQMLILNTLAGNIDDPKYPDLSSLYSALILSLGYEESDVIRNLFKQNGLRIKLL